MTRNVGDILQGLVPAAEPDRDRLNELLGDLLDPKVAGTARVASLKRGTATIEVESSCLLHELRTFQNDEILEAFQSELDGVRVRRLVFRLCPRSSTE